MNCDRILRPADLCEITGLSLNTVKRLRRRGDLPTPLQLAPRAIGWPESTVRDWIESRAKAQRSTGSTGQAA